MVSVQRPNHLPCCIYGSKRVAEAQPPPQTPGRDSNMFGIHEHDLENPTKQNLSFAVSLDATHAVSYY